MNRRGTREINEPELSEPSLRIPYPSGFNRVNKQRNDSRINAVSAELSPLSHRPRNNRSRRSTGSGCIIISVLKRVIASGTGVELSAPALAVARRNAEIHKIGSRLELTQADALNSDIVTKLVSEADVIVSNPPYINTDVIDTLSPQVRSLASPRSRSF